MKKSLIFAVMLTIAGTCTAANESENKSENEAVAESAANAVDEVLTTIDADIVSKAFYVAPDSKLYQVEYGKRFIRIRDFRTHRLVSALSLYLCKENGNMIEGANSVLYDSTTNCFYPAKVIRTTGGITYQAANLAQSIPGGLVKQLEKSNRIKL